MKLKLVVVDLELSKRAKRVAAAMLVPVLVIAGGAVAYAGMLHTWKDGDTLNATDLNGNFADLDGRVSKLEAQTYLESTSDVAESGAFAADFVYQSISLDLTPGTWLVQGFGSVSTTVAIDQVQIALWDDTNSVEIPNSRSPIGTTDQSTNCSGSNGCQPFGAMTSSVISVAASTTVRLKVFRNGGSQVWLGSPVQLALPAANRLTALRLK